MFTYIVHEYFQSSYMTIAGVPPPFWQKYAITIICNLIHVLKILDWESDVTLNHGKSRLATVWTQSATEMTKSTSNCLQ